jgi:anti-sigma regulatory factor (Ser/Thr protein kinase)
MKLRRPTDPGDSCGIWPVRMAPQLSQVRASVQELARRRYAHPSLDAPERTLSDVIERLALVVSELGGNALRHAHAPVSIRLARVRHGWLLSVADGDPAVGPTVPSSDDAEVSGRSQGLLVVARISDDFGWYADPDCKHVWAIVPDAPPAKLVARLARD